MTVNTPKQAIIVQQIYTIRRALRLSLLAVIVLTLVSVFFFGKVEAQATILGALIAWLSQLIFAVCYFRYVGATQAFNIYKSMWRGHVAKWLVTLLGFLMIFVILKPLAPLFSLMSYILLTVVYMVVLALLSRQN